MSKENVITIQKTSKSIKVLYLIACGLIILGFVLGLQGKDNSAIGGLCILGGVVTYLVYRWKKWWNHS